MGLLGYAVTKLGNASYEDMLQNQIFKPLNMTSSTSNRKDVASKLVKGRNKKGKPAPNWDMAAFEGAGAILSTVSDLTKYTLWNFKALQNELQVMKELRFKTSEENGVALGWHIKNLSASSPVYWHNGATGGYKSCMAMDLEQPKRGDHTEQCGGQQQCQKDGILIRCVLICWTR
ncbi:MAG: serine hydrolase domain-containing protein [Saprospiraceae bacterium]